MFLAGGEGRSSMGKQMAKIVQAVTPTWNSFQSFPVSPTAAVTDCARCGSSGAEGKPLAAALQFGWSIHPYRGCEFAKRERLGLRLRQKARQ